MTLNGLSDWPALSPLRETPFTLSAAQWVGWQVLDRHARAIGLVRDLLVESRGVEETGAGPGVRPVYAVVATRPACPWRGSRDLLLPLAGLSAHDGALHTCRDAAELWLTLFGRELDHA